MKTYQIIFLLFFSITVLTAQVKKEKLYDPNADAAKELRAAIRNAAASGKHVLVQVGGNWCRWCIKLDSLFKNNAKIDSLLKTDFVLVRVNYSKENQNLPLLRLLEYPQRFGFPVLLVLNGFGKRLHTQDSGLLESGDRHDPEKVLSFLINWNHKALDSKQYQEKVNKRRDREES